MNYNWGARYIKARTDLFHWQSFCCEQKWITLIGLEELNLLLNLSSLKLLTLGAHYFASDAVGSACAHVGGNSVTVAIAAM
ncbi:hypothetical protein J2X24_000023 [Asticcacaulis solisilvae]|nr:hypothetical protein [Asticcacaulis solisilvae]MDR6798524.1 hypothetical protein [Asticcacaulis sp. BE141]